MSFLKALLFPPPPSIFVSAMSVISFTSLAIAGASEVMGRHLRYSKFWDAAGGAGLGVKQIRISSRAGMLLIYAPAMIAAVAAPFAVPGLLDGVRSQLVTAAVAIHFAKRVLEVLFLHSYSGQMILDSIITISLSYFLFAVTVIYSQHLVQNTPEPAVNSTYVGVVLFLVGISGNFYHHYLLSRLRAKGEKVYKMPKGGLFGWVICPHYLFEITIFIGISLMSQTVYSLSFTLGSTAYLLGRSHVTRRWYLTKFEDFPKDVKALVPYVF
ncbi:Polyprenol reductase 1 [Platanthera zijinensis]|uniref:Polyprenol reductase 1 n=1 Tax=Platanthera zijinensis TaxID=2320716 RepID=A0AAP0BMG6_9ASPA